VKKLIKYLLYFTHYPLLLLIKKGKCENNLPKGNYLIAANHSSIFDPILLTMFFYHNYGIWIRFLATEKIYRHKVNLIYLYAFDSIKIEEKNKGKIVNITANLLKKGECIGIFPEGKRVLKRERKVKTGVVRMSSISGKPILPVKIVGLKDKNAKLLSRLKRSSIIIGKPFYVQWKEENENVSGYTKEEKLQKESKLIMDKIYSLR
jgi:1-acyl-sn-glycerol-3-phosphate acyltransferase